MLLFENETKTGGGPIERHEYNVIRNELVLYFKDSFVANKVVNFGAVKHGEQTYIAKKYEIKG